MRFLLAAFFSGLGSLLPVSLDPPSTVPGPEPRFPSLASRLSNRSTRVVETGALPDSEPRAPSPESRVPDTSTRAVVEAAAAYVREYEQQLTSIVADEHYHQQISSQYPPDSQMPRSRTTLSEMFFLFADRHWMAIRDVAAVDGRPVQSRPDVHAALMTLRAADVARTFKSYNSRFNLGRVIRNFNEPTLALLVLDDNYRTRVSFDRQRVETVGGTTLVTLAFAEKSEPTLIFDLKLRPAFSKGQFIVEAGTGRVARTFLTVKVQGIVVELTTIYSSNERLAMWVPTTFEERYQERSKEHGISRHEEIVCDATYTNFRRFEASARIK